MPFNTALSGIRAASTELSVAGNNIANASTTGFKGSRVEFGDVYATSVGGSANIPGAGVQVLDIAQSFSQGNVTFTENQLDLAINGNGFFVVSQDGETQYTRAGVFGLDNEGFIVGSTGARLQGFGADESGNIDGIPNDIQVQISNLAPRQTTDVNLQLNLDSTESVLQSTGRVFSTEGNAIGDTQAGLIDSTVTELTGATFNLPMTTNFATESIDFDLSLSASDGNNGTVSISLDTLSGVPTTVQSFNDVRTLVTAINAQIFSPVAPQTAIDLSATAVDLGGGDYAIEFTALRDGEASSIALSNQNAEATQAGLGGAGTLVQGEPAVTNGYPSQSIDITDDDDNVFTYTSAEGATAAEIASELNSIQGVTASARAQATIASYNNSNGNMNMTLNGVELVSDDLASLAAEINSYSNSVLPGITATVDASAGTVVIDSTIGDDFSISIDSTDDEDSISIQGSATSTPQTLEVDTNAALSDPGTVLDASSNAIVVGGAIDITIDEGFSVGNESPLGQFFELLGDSTDDTNPVFESVVLNDFDPSDQNTFNSSTSMTIFDSLGNSHIMTQYYVKQPYDENDATTASNHWEMHVLIDGEDVGDPDIDDPTEATRATFNVFFNEDGSLNENLSDDILISNWTPTDNEGEPNGALGPQNVLAGGSTVIPNPPTSSNFVIDLEGTTQFGSAFSVNDVAQDGFTTGRLSGMSIDDTGIIFARFTNGESQVLGQIVLADFASQEGLQPVGNSMWVENFASGAPNVGTPNSAALGTIQSGALEESNVDLSEQLVDLIIAQRNFQASAKTIETASQTTQTIINLR